MKRRALLAASALLPIAACTISTSGTTTTVTVNVADIDNYGQVAVSAVGTILSIAAVASAIGAPAVAIINAASAALAASLKDFDKACNGSLTFSLDNASLKSAAQSVAGDMAAVLTDLQSAQGGLAGHIGAGDLANVNTVIAAAETAVALIRALLGMVSASANAPRVRLSREAMFRAVGMAPRR
jgi:hypothetical protein